MTYIFSQSNCMIFLWSPVTFEPEYGFGSVGVFRRALYGCFILEETSCGFSSTSETKTSICRT